MGKSSFATPAQVKASIAIFSAMPLTLLALFLWLAIS